MVKTDKAVSQKLGKPVNEFFLKMLAVICFLEVQDGCTRFVSGCRPLWAGESLLLFEFRFSETGAIFAIFAMVDFASSIVID